MKVPIVSAEQGVDVLRRSTKQRHKATTGLNYASSRSHSVFTITVKWSSNDAQGRDRSHMYFVDLAGVLPFLKTVHHLF